MITQIKMNKENNSIEIKLDRILAKQDQSLLNDQANSIVINQVKQDISSLKEDLVRIHLRVEFVEKKQISLENSLIFYKWGLIIGFILIIILFGNI